MKIRLSLRRYFLVAMVFLGLTLVTGFTLMSLHYSVQGMDHALRGTMAEIALQTQLQPGQRIDALGFTVSDSWQNQPEPVRARFPAQPEIAFELYKQIERHSIFEKPRRATFVMRIDSGEGNSKYISRVLGKPPIPVKEDFIDNRLLVIVLIALCSTLVFVGLLLVILKTIAAPIESLGRWASQLTPERLRQTPPAFRYNELNKLAGVVHQSLSSVQQALDREHQFLRHASHELRTPIAVVRNNTELLNKLIAHPDDKQARVIERIERAGLTMSHLTETLLWLSRDEHDQLPAAPLRLDQELRLYADEQRYLLERKAVTVEVTTEPLQLTLPATACRIVLTNLIRNAFQHTQTGQVQISQHGSQVTIINHDSNSQSDDTEQLGYGLGLALTERLCHRLGWRYRNQACASGHQASVDFSPNAEHRALQ